MKHRAPLRVALGGFLLLAGAPAWSQAGSLRTWVDACRVTDHDLVQLLEAEALVVDETAINANEDGTFTLDQQAYTHTGIQGPQPICTDSRFYKQAQERFDKAAWALLTQYAGDIG